MSKSAAYLNRELSWLEFNQRVLDEATNPDIPLLERLKFLAITASNLDEFFMVRVGGLTMLSARGHHRPDFSGMTPEQQLVAIRQRAAQMVTDQYACYLDELQPQLEQEGVRHLTPEGLSETQVEYVKRIIDDEVLSILTPQAIDIEGIASGETPFPLLGNRTLTMAVRLAPAPVSPAEGQTEPEPPVDRYALIPFGSLDSRFLTLPGEGEYSYLLFEDAVRMLIDRFFPGEDVREAVLFRITRNADLELQEDEAADLLSEMETILDARKDSSCIRLEIENDVSPELLSFLKTHLELTDEQVYRCRGPLDFSAFMRLSGLKGFSHLTYPEWPSMPSPEIDPAEPLFETIRQQDVLLYHPYQSFRPVLRFIDEAADDPDVLAIKQTLYRTSRNSPIVEALMRAAAAGKSVTALVEIKARFDEQRNIGWAKRLEAAGVQVIYGVKGLKTHAKVCMIVRRGASGIQRYCHFGTGNYNEGTARLYGDISYFTAREDLTADAAAFFNAICGYSQPITYRQLSAAPFTLRDRLLELIEGEVRRKKEGQEAFIHAKVNSLADPTLIDALSAAAEAGVSVKLNIRGICCLRPMSDRVVVTSILDRYLEHARIMHFHRGGDDLVLISSADWMRRNLDRRVELLVPVVDPDCRRFLIRCLDLHLQDTAKAKRLRRDGSYVPVKPRPKNAEPLRSQKALSELATELVKKRQMSPDAMFEPHRAPDE